MQFDQTYPIIKKVTLVSVFLNTLLAILKIIVGFVGHSQALIADGIHSFSDLLSDGMVLLAAKLGHQKPDLEHPYGHRRIETLGAILISILLLLVGAGLIWDNVSQYVHQEMLKPNYWVLIVAVISILTNEWLFRYCLKYADQIHSNLLRSNAYHNRGDAWVSIVVLISVIAAMLGWEFIDVVAAIVIAILIIRMGFTLMLSGIKELIDTGVSADMLKLLKAVIHSVPGVIAVHDLRTRSLGGSIFVDVHIIVPSMISVSEGHHIGEQVHQALMRDVPMVADVIVHIDPENDEDVHLNQNLPNRNDIIAQLKQAWHDLPGIDLIQNIRLHYLAGKISVDVYLPSNILDTQDKLTLENSYKQQAQTVKHIKEIKLFYS